MLVQVIGGTPSGSTALSASPGMPGIMWLFGPQASTAAADDLQALLSGLIEQLDKLGTDADLPAPLQEQLAALLLALQSLLQPIGTVPQRSGAADMTGGETAAQGAAVMPQTAPAAPQAIVQMLRQTLQQLTERLTQGEPLPIQQSALAEPLRQALDALRQAVEAKPQASQEPDLGVNRETLRTAATGGGNSRSAHGELPQPAQAPVVVKAQTVIQQSAMPIRNPVWAFQAIASADAGGTSGAQTAHVPADAAESGSPGQPTPLWTMLKAAPAVPTSGASPSSPPAQVPVQQFADQAGQLLIRQFVLTRGNGASEAKISLHPEHLGQVDIKIVIQNGLLTAKFVAENGAARDLLEAQMSQLRTALQSQGLQVEKMEVVQQSSAGAAAFLGQQRQQGSANPEQQVGYRRSGGKYEDGAEFELELERTAYLREIGFGGSLNVTA